MGDLFRPSEAVLKECLENIGDAQDKQVATYAERQLHGSVPTKKITTPLLATPTPATHSPVTITTPPIDLTSNIISSSITIPATSTVKVKQEPPCSHEPKRREKAEIQKLDFVVVKVHKVVRKEGDRKGKLASKAEGPYRVADFTDDSKQIAIIEDADGQTWTRRVADLSLWE